VSDALTAHPTDPQIQPPPMQIGFPFQERYTAEIVRLREQYGITGVATGDIDDVAGGFMAGELDRSTLCSRGFLANSAVDLSTCKTPLCCANNAAAAAGAGVDLVTLLWQLPTAAILCALLDLGLTARISCVALAKFAALPATTDQQAAEEKSQPAAAEGDQQEDKADDSYSCHCSLPPPLPPGPPRFDAVKHLLGRQITAELVSGGLSEAVQAVGVDLAGEDGSYHSVVTGCPLMGGRRVALAGEQCVDREGGYAYMVWSRVEVVEGAM
jgi:hypothetical protein